MRKLLLICGGVMLLSLIALAGVSREVDESFVGANLKSVEVELDFAIGEYELHPGELDPGVFAKVEGLYDEERFDYKLDFQERNGRGNLLFALESRHHKNLDWDDDTENNWEFTLSPDVPIDLIVDIGAADAELELGGLALREFDLDVGAADTRINFSEPNRQVLEMFRVDAGACDLEMRGLGNCKFEHLDFDGGVGSFTLDFTGEFDFEASAEISVGLGSIEIILPEDIGVRIEAEDNWLSSIDLPRRHFDRVDEDVYETENYETATGKLTLQLDVGLGSADISIK
ncbi:MAG: LiaF domain-containing protein [bacterium]